MFPNHKNQNPSDTASHDTFGDFAWADIKKMLHHTTFVKAT
jgi:hypothetical protein